MARPTVARCVSGAERCLLGSAHPRYLARAAASLSSLSHLLSPLPIRVVFGTVDQAATETGRGFARSRKSGFERIVYRRQLQFGEKGGSDIGPTLRGKGSKIMATSNGMVFLSPRAWPALRRVKQTSSKSRLNGGRFSHPTSASRAFRQLALKHGSSSQCPMLSYAPCLHSRSDSRPASEQSSRVFERGIDAAHETPPSCAVLGTMKPLRSGSEQQDCCRNSLSGGGNK